VSRGRSGLTRKISFRMGFDPRIVQPASNRHTDYTIPVTMGKYTVFIIYNLVKDTFGGSDCIAWNDRKISE
jgi:hypothetical protein